MRFSIMSFSCEVVVKKVLLDFLLPWRATTQCSRSGHGIAPYDRVVIDS